MVEVVPAINIFVYFPPLSLLNQFWLAGRAAWAKSNLKKKGEPKETRTGHVPFTYLCGQQYFWLLLLFLFENFFQFLFG
jgi:hypothetical protein